jgi:hypothetical protein
MDAKDKIYAVGIVVTLLLGVWNFIQLRHAARHASFINTVTAQRIEWIEKLRQDIGRFVGLTHHWSRTEPQDETKHTALLQELDTLRYVIRLRLNPDDTPDRRVADLIRKIPDITHSLRRQELDAAVEELVTVSQQIIKAEWEKVKDEAKYGDLKDR